MGKRLKKIKRLAIKYYFSKELPLDYRIFILFYIECLIVSIVSAVLSTVGCIEFKLWNILAQWFFVICCIVVLIISARRHISVRKSMLLATAFIFIPFFLFQTNDFQSPAILFCVIALFVIAIVFNGWQRVALISANIGLWVIIFILKLTNPDIFSYTETNETTKIINYMMAQVLSCMGISFLGTYFHNAFNLERKRIQQLIQELEQSNQTLTEMSHRDPLTGLYNRRFLNQFLERELESCYKNNSNLCIMMLDLDKFKMVNDEHGHGFGDNVLIQFSETVTSQIRSYDVFSRIGGEEFLIVLHTNLQTATQVAERIRMSVEKMQFRIELKITVSIGVIQLKNGEHIDDAFDRVDKCLYRAKNEGRNRVVSSEI